jgi:hypothetical protein
MRTDVTPPFREVRYCCVQVNASHCLCSYSGMHLYKVGRLAALLEYIHSLWVWVWVFEG